MHNMTSKLSLSSRDFTRRQFLRRTTLAVGAATLAFPYVGRVLGANEHINVACIGVGGKGDSDSSDAAGCGGNIVAICDVDKSNLARKAKQFAEKFPQLQSSTRTTARCSMKSARTLMPSPSRRRTTTTGWRPSGR